MQHMHKTDSDMSCAVLPAIAYFTDLRKSRSFTKALCRTPTEPDTPTVNRPGTLTCQNAVFFELNDSDESVGHYHTGNRAKRARITLGEENGDIVPLTS